MKKIIAAALALSACGTWSNEDLEFVYALPDKATVHAAAPGQSSSTGQGLLHQGLNAGEDSPQAQGTIKLSTGFNTYVDSILDGIDGVRVIPPTSRTDDTRTWGPYNDSQHPGFEVEVEIERDGGSGGEYEYDWQLRYRQTGGQFFDICVGNFIPTETLKIGEGGFFIDALSAREIFDAGKADDPDHLTVTYITDKSPKQVSMFFDKDAGVDAGSYSLGYQYEQNDAGDTHATFIATGGDPNITTLEYDAKWNASGEGFMKASILAGNWADAGIRLEECWDSAQKVVYSNMIFDAGTGPDGGTPEVGLPGACVDIQGP
jgi:hypothetical protein